MVKDHSPPGRKSKARVVMEKTSGNRRENADHGHNDDDLHQ